jgi:hypothetical protein
MADEIRAAQDCPYFIDQEAATASVFTSKLGGIS